MTKDSQVDKKSVRMEKCDCQTPLTRETAKNHNATIKKQSNRK